MFILSIIKIIAKFNLTSVNKYKKYSTKSTNKKKKVQYQNFLFKRDK